MAVLFDGSTTHNILYSSPPVTALGLTQSTLIFTVNRSTPVDYSILFQAEPTAGTDELFFINMDYSTGYDAGKISYLARWSGGNADWYSTNDVLSTGEQEIAITYDASSAANNPIFYVNGVSVAVTSTGARSGSYVTGTNCDIRIGSSVIPSTICTIRRILRYNRILSASEILEAYNSKLAVPSWRGLVFAPPLWAVKDGQALGASDVVRDLISGASGVPTGSPIGRGDNVLTIEGVT